MKRIFSVNSLIEKYILVEKALIYGLAKAGIAPSHCIEVFEKCSETVTPGEVYTKEAEIGHDIAGLAYLLGEKCGECGRYAHLGATSYDIVDTAWALVFREALGLVSEKLLRVINRLKELTVEYRDLVMVGRTHAQHAVPITVGFKFANYVYEFTRSYERICDLKKRLIKAKMSGAVGTMAGWLGKGLIVERGVCEHLGLPPHEISTQIAPRDGFAELVSTLAILASQLDRLALEVRELSRPEINEIYEATKRVGSSTMPHKRNPVTAERICGLAKIARSLVVAALENIPLMHERDLTNSSSERVLIPHVFLVVDQMLEDTLKLLNTIYIDREAIKKNLELTRGAIMAESVMVRLVLKGMARHEAHKLLIDITRNMKPGETLKEALLRNEVVSKYLSQSEIEEAVDPEKYLGNINELIERTMKYAEEAIRNCSSS